MESDKHFYEIFSDFPEFLFALIGMKTRGKHRFSSTTVKELERHIDGLFVPQNPKGIHWVLEVQMQRPKPGENIYFRLATEVSTLFLQNPSKQYRGILIFGDRSCDTKTEPWHSEWIDSIIFSVYYLDDLLKELEKKDPYHPLVLLFNPFFAKKKPEPTLEAGKTS